MKIAVTYENGDIFQHFGHTEQFKFYDVTEGKVISSEIVSTMGSGHGALAEFLTRNDINALICGGIGAGAKMALEEAGITLYGGASGDADESVQALLENKLNFNVDVTCNHPHDEEHNCGEHSCSSH